MNEDDPVTNKACHERSGAILSAIQTLDDRLYRDNGRLSIQTRLDRHERFLNALCWVLSIAGSTIIVAMIGLILKTVLFVNLLGANT